jgi:hypothetical protein
MGGGLVLMARPRHEAGRNAKKHHQTSLRLKYIANSNVYSMAVPLTKYSFNSFCEGWINCK